jgi:CheY-like chemotaxis protein
MNRKQPHQTVLLVDDDPHVRRLCRLCLERSGFGVIEADSSGAAHTVWAAHAESIALLITDHDMPGGDGLELSAALRSANPELPILLISGNSISPVPASIRFLAKPFTPAVFLQHVQACISPRHLR